MQSFAEAVVKAANLRGDSDSVAAVTGQLAGAIYGLSGIPAAWVADVERWDGCSGRGGGGIAARAHCLFAGVPARRRGAVPADGREAADDRHGAETSTV